MVDGLFQVTGVPPAGSPLALAVAGRGGVSAGAVCLFNSEPTDLIADVNGYLA